jgi:predicted dehydrogenase
MHHEPLRVGLIGCGNVALSDHVPAYRRARSVSPVALADPTGPVELDASERPDADCDDESTALLLGDLDPIDVCTPQHLHRSLVISAFRCGRPVRETLATTPRDAWAMVEAARAADRTLAIMHNHLFFTEVARTLELIAAGRPGRSGHQLAVLDKPGTRPTDRPTPTADWPGGV